MGTAIVMSASAKMPSSCKGRYGHVAVVEVIAPTYRPKMISEHARGVMRILWDSGPCSMGKTDRCAYAVAMREARAIADRYNDTLVAIRGFQPFPADAKGDEI